MNTTLQMLLIVFAGFVAGMVCGSLILRWIALAWAARGSRPDGHAPSGTARALVILHPVPWLLFGGLAYGAYRLAVNPPGRQWIWFFGVTIGTIVALYIYSIAVGLLRRRKEKSPGGQP